jgi:hypothetical protein
MKFIMRKFVAFIEWLDENIVSPVLGTDDDSKWI